MVVVANANQTADAAAPVECFPVLVIDDSDVDREITLHHLGQAWPFEHEMAIDTATDGHEALERIRTKHFALIVLDWKLPGLGGGEVLRAMRQAGVRAPVIVLSGLGRDQIAEKLESFGAAFLNKDEMNSETFRAAIASSLQLLATKHTGATVSV